MESSFGGGGGCSWAWVPKLVSWKARGPSFQDKMELYKLLINAWEVDEYLTIMFLPCQQNRSLGGLPWWSSG